MWLNPWLCGSGGEPGRAVEKWKETCQTHAVKQKEIQQRLGPLIPAWFQAHKRALPWRGISDPYAVWVSEIMLQQTRIESVIGYYARFMAAFPTVEALAQAPIERVLKCWEGLGYYSRARNLQRGAQQVAAQGAFPKGFAAWRAVPGVGAYTAAALASLCDGEAVPVVDGNVIRVVSRLRAVREPGPPAAARPGMMRWLQPVIEASGAPGDFNEGLMELGETVCLPRAPRCGACPVRALCKGAASGAPERFPGLRKRREVPERQFAAFVVRNGAEVMLVQRPPQGLLAGFRELPMVETQERPTLPRAKTLLRERFHLVASRLRYAGTLTHVFTHFRQVLWIYEVIGSPAADGADAAVPGFYRPETCAVTTASRRILGLGQRRRGGASGEG